ncbi:hypothetical protein P7K49_031412 [Saguinus oedipus]|uniref:Uncharacterized protein n=1 Tax=Saguinus oedipus TaxID=9490 RepID=A0ABQ9U013_SAGOE|nr:hypothetical protein P7K49_031412 [Saguinus oedipus]
MLIGHQMPCLESNRKRACGWSFVREGLQFEVGLPIIIQCENYDHTNTLYLKRLAQPEGVNPPPPPLPPDCCIPMDVNSRSGHDCSTLQRLQQEQGEDSMPASGIHWLFALLAIR